VERSRPNFLPRKDIAAMVGRAREPVKRAAKASLRLSLPQADCA
jgi:hypothetical protein